MPKELIKALKEDHNRDVDKLHESLKSKVDKAVFHATIAPIKRTSGLILGGVITVITAIIITALT